MTVQERLLLLVLASVNFTHIVDFMILMPLGPQLMELFAITPYQFGIVVSAYGIAAGIAGFLLSFVADRWDRKRVLFGAYLGFLFGTFACAFAPGFAWLTAARVVSGAFGGVLGSQVMAIVADSFDYQRRASAMGLVMTAFSVASVVGVPGGLYLTNLFSWHAPFLAVTALGVVVAVLIAVVVPSQRAHLAVGSAGPAAPEGPAPRERAFDALRRIARDENQRAALLFSVVLMLGHFSVIPYISPSLVANANFSQEDLYLIYLVGGLLTIFSAPIVGRISDRVGKFPVFAVFAVLSVVPVWLITHLGPTPLPLVLTLTGAFFIITNGRMIPTQAMVSSVVAARHRGAFMSINSSVQLLTNALATQLAGAVITRSEEGRLLGYGYVGVFSIAMLLCSVWLARRLRTVS